MQVQTSEQTGLFFLISGKSRFPPKKFYKIDYRSSHRNARSRNDSEGNILKRVPNDVFLDTCAFALSTLYIMSSFNASACCYLNLLIHILKLKIPYEVFLVRPIDEHLSYRMI